MSGWQDSANCATTDPELFVLDSGGSTIAAKKICGACDVREQCLQFAIDKHIYIGIWGGLSPVQRRAMRRAAA